MSNIAKLADHPRRQRNKLLDRLKAVTPGQLESDERERKEKVREYDVGRFRNQIKYAAARLAELEGENAADEWLTQCMSRGVTK